MNTPQPHLPSILRDLCAEILSVSYWGRNTFVRLYLFCSFVLETVSRKPLLKFGSIYISHSKVIDLKEKGA